MIVEGRGLTVVYGERTVLDGTDVALAAGARCALTGRSGSGKTTLLLVLAGLLVPTRGSVRCELDPRDVVYVPQAPSLVPELSAVQNASLGLRIRGVAPAEAEDHGRDALRHLGLTSSDDALPAELSGGMQQRVALARALAVRPRLLLADEPTGALDQRTGQLVLDHLLESTAERGTTLVVATHDEDVAARLDDRLVVGTALTR